MAGFGHCKGGPAQAGGCGGRCHGPVEGIKPPKPDDFTIVYARVPFKVAVCTTTPPKNVLFNPKTATTEWLDGSRGSSRVTVEFTWA